MTTRFLRLFMAVAITAAVSDAVQAQCPAEQNLPECSVSCPLWENPPAVRDCKAGIDYDPQTHRVVGASCSVTSSGCQETADLCELLTGASSQRSASESCPDPCSGGGCPPGYTHNCVGDQQPDPSNCNCCVNFTPILIDVRGLQRFALSDAAHGVVIDINGYGALHRVAWPAAPVDDAFLFLDRNGNGVFDSAAELFGNTTPLVSGRYPSSGYEAMAELDSNRDGWIDDTDALWRNLRLWRDGNRNGISEPAELLTLHAVEITRLSLEAREVRRQDANGNRFILRARVAAENAPKLRFSYDVILASARP